MGVAAWAEVAMVGATSEVGVASAVLPTVRLVGRLAVAAREAAVMAPEGPAREVGAAKALGALGAAARVAAAWAVVAWAVAVMAPEGLAREAGEAKALGALGVVAAAKAAVGWRRWSRHNRSQRSNTSPSWIPCSCSSSIRSSCCYSSNRSRCCPRKNKTT